MNTVILMGRLTQDPEVRYIQGANAMAVAHYRLAVDRRFKRDGQPEADFFNLVSFGKQGEFVEKYLQRGSKIVVSGHLQNNNYQDKDGKMVYRDVIVTDSVEFAESKKASSSGAGSGTQGAAPAKSSASSRPESKSAASEDADGFMNIPDSIDEELPFN